jgi:hypothetical protein
VFIRAHATSAFTLYSLQVAAFFDKARERHAPATFTIYSFLSDVKSIPITLGGWCVTSLTIARSIPGVNVTGIITQQHYDPEPT